MKRTLLLVCIALSLIACNKQTSPDLSKRLIDIPPGFPEMPIPADNPLTAQKIELGRRLFYDPILSQDGTISCASCHKQEYGFADNTPTSAGVRNEIGVRNSMAIANAGYSKVLLFDGRATTLEDQVLDAIRNPAEMHSDERLAGEKLQAKAEYVSLFRAAFGNSTVADGHNAVKAIACFLRTIVSGASPYDRFTRGDSSALSVEQQRGMKLFYGNRAKCAVCHSGFNFTDEKFHSTGLYFHYWDVGRYDVTRNEKDRGTFRTPSLRNIALTAPYMHDGETFTLEQVMKHYNKGGKQFVNKDPIIEPLKLSHEEIADIIAFLRSLTDDNLATSPYYAKP